MVERGPPSGCGPISLRDPGVAETCTTWGQLIEGVYASVWHQHLMRDPAFQAARQERDHQRVFLRS